MELLIALSLLGLALSLILGPMIYLIRSNYALGNMAFLTNQSRLGVEQLGMDLRSAVDITSANSAGISITVEDPDGVQDTIIYAYNADSGVLSRKVGAGDTISLVRDLEWMSFNFFDSDDTATTKLIDVKKVEVDMALSISRLDLTNEYEYRSARFVMRNRPAG